MIDQNPKTEEGNHEKPAVLFLDTNILLQFKPLTEIDWNSIVNSSNIELVLCSQVIYELDEKKADKKCCDRARTAIAQLKEIKNNRGLVRKGIVLTFIRNSHTLATGNADWNIIAAAKDYAQSHNACVTIVSDDIGMALQCENNGVQCVELDDKWRKPLDDEQAQKIKKLEQENKKLKNVLPILHVLASHPSMKEPDRSVDTKLTPPLPVGKDTILAKVRAENPLLTLKSLSIRRISGLDIEEHNAKLEAFFSQYSDYLEKLRIQQSIKALALELTLWIENTGGGPADEVEIDMSFPERFQRIIDKVDGEKYFQMPIRRADPLIENIFRDVREPDAPELKIHTLTDLMRGVGSFSTDATLISRIPRFVEPPMPSYETIKVNGNQVTLYARSAKHKKQLEIGTVVAVFSSWDQVGCFEIPYEIHANNLPDVVKDKLVIRVSKGT